MKHLTLLIACSLFFQLSFAQVVNLSGKISDEKGEAVSFASIYIKNTTKGTSANSDGLYRLGLKAGSYELVISAVGYQQLVQRIDLPSDRQLNFTLREASYQLKDVIVQADAEDPAYAIIRNAIKRRKSYLNELRAYETEVYIKGMQKLTDAPKKFMGLNIDELGKQLGLDSNRRGIIYLSESESKLSFQKPDQYREELISSKFSGSNRAFSFNRATDLKVNFYENYQKWEGLSLRPLVSPIAEDALLYYQYKFLGNVLENGQMVNKIQVLPKRPTDPVFSGSIYIIEDSWRIHSTDLQITKASNLNFVDTLKIKQEFIPVNPSVWMPTSVKMEFTGGFFGFRFGGYFVAVFKNYDLAPELARINFKEALKITQGINKKDSLYWHDSRPIPLTAEEKADYEKKEKLAAKRESKPYLDSLDRANNQFKLKKILTGSGFTFRNRYERKFYRVNSLLGSTYYNTVEGFGIDYGASYTHRIDSVLNKFVNISGNLRYGFSNHLFTARMSADFPAGDYTISLKMGSDVVDLNNQGSVPVLYNTINTLFYERNLLKLYQKNYASAAFSRRVLGNVRINFSVEYASRNSLANTSLYTLRNLKDQVLSSNNPFSPDVEQPLFPQHQTFKIGFRASYNFNNRYVTYPSGKYYTGSKYPSLGIQYVKAISGVFGSDINFDQLAVDLSKSDIPMGFYGKTSFNLAAGKFMQTRNLYFPDYHHFLGNQNTIFESKLNSFLFLDFYRFSTPERYAEGHVMHNFSGFILNKVPLIRKLKLQELAGFNYLNTPQLKNYQEYYAGLQYLNFKVFYGWAFQNGERIQQGFRMSISLN
ncbi:MAG: hypothetical protein RI924_704 [Bacteroidota bacterium]|jgi:hypothetical protein